MTAIGEQIAVGIVGWLPRRRGGTEDRSVLIEVVGGVFTAAVRCRGCREVSNAVNRSQFRLCFVPINAVAFYVPLLRLLQSAQSIWQFSATVLPPFAHGVMWSACISSMAK